MNKLKYDEKYYTFLDGLRESGRTDMFGATPYLLNQFHELDPPLAGRILESWMETFHERHPPKPKVVRVKGNIDDECGDWLHRKRKRG